MQKEISSIAQIKKKTNPKTTNKKALKNSFYKVGWQFTLLTTQSLHRTQKPTQKSSN